MNTRNSLVLLTLVTLVTILLAACGPTPGTQGQPSNGGDTAKLEQDIAALSAKVDANQAALLARSDTTIQKLDGIVTLISNNQTANMAAFHDAGVSANAATTTINAKLDQLLALHASVPPPDGGNGEIPPPEPPPDTSFSATVEWDYEHTDDGLGPISGFNIQRSTDGGTTWNDFVQVAGADVRKYIDTPVALGPTYCYRVITFRVREGGAVIDYSPASTNAACTVGPTPPAT